MVHSQKEALKSGFKKQTLAVGVGNSRVCLMSIYVEEENWRWALFRKE